MKFALGWLAEYIDLPVGAEELAERLTVGGLEIEGIERTGPDLSGVRVGHVLERAKHPDADSLSVCKVDLGDGEPVDIVCGAPNVASGQKVAVASPGSRLPDGTKLKKTKIRGVVSRGMICSDRELGLGDSHEGIKVLPDEASLGAPLTEVVPAGDIVLDVEITPNRGDWVSMLGMAREVRAHYGGELRIPDFAVAEVGRATSEDISIEIEDSDGCFCYVGRVVRGITVGPSPEWLVAKLEAAGLRSINIVVDVTNLVLLEFGQPLHAFDLSTLRDSKICVRAAKQGEKILTLDDQTRELSVSDLVIADAERAIAIAGVMGGSETEVRDSTSDVLIESAHFQPARVRRTARRLGLQTDASYRFERGVDGQGIARAADRCATLLAELAGGSVSKGRVEARGGDFQHCDEVELDPKRVNRLLGTKLSTEEITALLARLEIRASLSGEGRLCCSIPSHRNDLAIPADIVEEVARIYGYDRIETTLPMAQIEPVSRPREAVISARVRDSLVGSGMLEMRSFPGMQPGDLDALLLAEDDPRRRVVRLVNPISEEEGVLRSTFLPSILRATLRNLSHQVDRVRLFEVGRLFLDEDGRELPNERNTVAGVLTRGQRSSLWEPAQVPSVFFEAKGIVERLLAELGFRARFHSGTSATYLHPGASGEFSVGKSPNARVGELHPKVAAHYDIHVPAAIFEVDLKELEGLGVRPVRFRDVSSHPAVQRDIAVVVGTDQPAGEILDEIRKTGGNHLVEVSLFDRYEGKGIPEGKVSLAFRMVFQRADRTLTDAEVSKSTERVVQMLSNRYGGEQR